MKIVILDGYTTSQNDLNFNEFRKFGEVMVYDHTPPERIVERAFPADILISNKIMLTRETIDQLPHLKYIGLLSTGFNVVDIAAAGERHIPVTNVPSYSTQAVAQHTFALILELCNLVGIHAAAVREGEWFHSRDFCLIKGGMTELSGKTIGIVGYGRIGSAVASIAEAFGMQVVVLSREPVDHPSIIEVHLTELFKVSDIVSLHCPLTPETEGIVNIDVLRTMKPSAFLINTSRGPVVHEQDLADALNNDIIAGAGLDVLAAEPPRPDNPLVTAKNCIITPHIAWGARSTRMRLIRIAADNIRAFLNGISQNVVN